MLLWLYGLPLCVSGFMSRSGPLLLSQADFIARPWTWAKQASAVTMHACSYLPRNLVAVTPNTCYHPLKLHIHFPHISSLERMDSRLYFLCCTLWPPPSPSIVGGGWTRDGIEMVSGTKPDRNWRGTRQTIIPLCTIFFFFAYQAIPNISVYCCVCNATHAERLVIVSVVYYSCKPERLPWLTELEIWAKLLPQ